MGIIKEYRIVMPVTVQEYRVAQIYMTARTQAMEAEQVRRLRFRKACSSSSNRAGCSCSTRLLLGRRARTCLMGVHWHKKYPP
jgi:hypothetical protein